VDTVQQRLSTLSFPDWLQFVFDHPGEGPEWYWDDDAPYWNAPPAITTDYVTRLFEAPLPALAPYSDAQLNRGLNYLISPGLGEHMLCLDSPEVPISARVRCVRACEVLFRDLLASRCAPHLSHRDRAGPGGTPLNLVCYMWWDTMPAYGGPNPADQQALQRAALDTMAAVLRLDSLACQESALHGLGHWHRVFPAEIERLIDDFLRTHPGANGDLVTYARSARCGCVL
jgi:hypothetical protein